MLGSWLFDVAFVAVIFGAFLGDSLLVHDGADHRRMRGAMSATFKPSGLSAASVGTPTEAKPPADAEPRAPPSNCPHSLPLGHTDVFVDDFSQMESIHNKWTFSQSASNDFACVPEGVLRERIHNFSTIKILIIH